MDTVNLPDFPPTPEDGEEVEDYNGFPAEMDDPDVLDDADVPEQMEFDPEYVAAMERLNNEGGARASE